MKAWFAIVMVLLPLTPLAAQTSPSPNLRRVAYGELAEMVRERRGEYLLVDFWFDACLPCKRVFIKLQQLEKAHKAQRVSVVSVNLDDPHDPAARQRALDFLRQQAAEGLHVQLRDPPATWQPKLQLEEVPCVFLFDRTGRLLHRWEGDTVDPAAIRARLERALAAEATPSTR